MYSWPWHPYGPGRLDEVEEQRLHERRAIVCAFQKLKQVYYSKSPNNDPWSIVLYSPKHLTTSVDYLEALTEFQSILDDNPELKKFLDFLK